VVNPFEDPWAFTKQFRHVRQDVFNKITECENGCFVTVTIVTPGDLDFISFYEQTVSSKKSYFGPNNSEISVFGAVQGNRPIVVGHCWNMGFWRFYPYRKLVVR